LVAGVDTWAIDQSNIHELKDCRSRTILECLSRSQKNKKFRLRFGFIEMNKDIECAIDIQLAKLIFNSILNWHRKLIIKEAPTVGHDCTRVSLVQGFKKSSKMLDLNVNKKLEFSVSFYLCQ
jgi:hypothetical protein